MFSTKIALKRARTVQMKPLMFEMEPFMFEMEPAMFVMESKKFVNFFMNQPEGVSITVDGLLFDHL